MELLEDQNQDQDQEIERGKNLGGYLLPQSGEEVASKNIKKDKKSTAYKVKEYGRDKGKY